MEQPISSAPPSEHLNTRFFMKARDVYQRHKALIVRIAIALGAVIFIGLNVFLFRYAGQVKRDRDQVPTISPTPTPPPIPFTHKGKMEFSISTTGGEGPRFIECSIDPLDFSTAQTQTFRVSIESAKPVVNASVLWQTDHTKTTVPLRLVSGTAVKGQWEGIYTVSDTAWYTYVLTIEANDGTNTKSTVLSLR